MASDLYLTITRTEPDSEIIRIYPNAPVIVYAAGTVTPAIFSGAANQYGVVEIPSLAAGQYDLWAAGAFQRSFYHLTSGYVDKSPRSWVFLIPGTLADVGETENTEVFYTSVAGKLLAIRVHISDVGASGEGVVHILRGPYPRSAALAVATDSLWSVQCNPGSATIGWTHQDEATQPAIVAGSHVTIGFDLTAGTLKGLTVEMMFKEDE
jgi:hypothetical protein